MLFRPVLTVYGLNISGKSLVGKPRKRRFNAVEIDRRGMLKARNWKRESLDKQLWRRLLMDTRALFPAVALHKKMMSLQCSDITVGR
jgi:hypothetical protein